MANDLTFDQISTLLNSIVQQATNQTQITPTNTGEFVALAQVALKCGYDTLLESVSQVVGRTIFSTRPYTRKLGGLRVSNQFWGNVTRKMGVMDSDWDNDVSWELEDGKSVDMYVVKKPDVLQTNFYGFNVFMRQLTIFRDQMNVAFRGPDELARFLTMIMTNSSDQIEQAHENLARATVANFIGGIVTGETAGVHTGRVIHLLQEYNTLTGLALTQTTVMQPDNYKGFIQYVYTRVAEITSLMTERSQMFQTNITNKVIKRHTPYARQKVYLWAPFRYSSQMRALADIYHDTFLRMADNDTVNFWQSISSPDKINVIPNYLTTAGVITSPTDAVEVENIMGVIFDEEAVGYTVFDEHMSRSPWNARGEYSNIFWHFTDRYWNDFTEKGVVLLLD